ncbi:hypothetical protein A1O7_08611 [Cladophialophora yegresii CBS 114405]|uniref:Phosducin domain-containing protein n=1 Tax=Cladophialophora yegresii CBS 114405 TaxID=1182544 RepID=W9VJ20_9EURO|nr:uncharacterized protein A1O7_08611 [Cladophialophora yegresii CBS 114405]EXJ55682.1 hypothetical protein A1O7_08611 [Cladophialophora yegresii CBS 114405]
MADLAREEAERYFSHRDHPTSHPEDRDRDQDSIHLSDDEAAPEHDDFSDPGTDDETVANMATMTSTKTTYHLPTQTHFANTGPKGVIADAQSYTRAKQSTFRQRLASFATNLASSNGKSTASTAVTEKRDNKRRSIFGTSPSKSTASSADSENIALSDDDADSEFMRTWRANRQQELSAQSQSSQSAYQRKPSQRSWGTFQEVDANGYLDAIEKVSDDTYVLVMIHDPSSSQSAEVEDELGMLAYKHTTTRFVKLDYEVAEMEAVQIPAVLAYRAGEVVATISGAKAEGLEGVLLQ